MVARYWTDEILAEVVREMRNGTTLNEIARRHGKDPTGLSGRLKRAGLETSISQGGWSRTLYIPDDPAVRGYFAGLMDGDGYFIKLSPGSGERKHVYYHAGVGMTNKPVIEWCAQFGGRMSSHQPSGARKLMWQWRVSRAVDVIHLIDCIEPYMRNSDRLARIPEIRAYIADRPKRSRWFSEQP